MEGSTLRGRKNAMKPAVSWHTTLLAKSSVLYLWRPWVAERGCSGREQALSVSHRTGGFCVLPDESPGVCASRIRLFRCRWCDGAERISEEILGAQQHHRGSQRDIIPRPAAATSPRHFGNAIVFCFERSSRSELRISSMALFANL